MTSFKRHGKVIIARPAAEIRVKHHADGNGAVHSGYKQNRRTPHLNAVGNIIIVAVIAGAVKQRIDHRHNGRHRRGDQRAGKLAACRCRERSEKNAFN